MESNHTGWKKIKCFSCAGHGLVCAYTMDGSDFLGAEECDCCNGSGRMWISPSGRLALYPGSPFQGSLTKKELQEL